MTKVLERHLPLLTDIRPAFSYICSTYLQRPYTFSGVTKSTKDQKWTYHRAKGYISPYNIKNLTTSASPYWKNILHTTTLILLIIQRDSSAMAAKKWQSRNSTIATSKQEEQCFISIFIPILLDQSHLLNL